jgi:hypothetical protein
MPPTRHPAHSAARRLCHPMPASQWSRASQSLSLTPTGHRHSSSCRPRNLPHQIPHLLPNSAFLSVPTPLSTSSTLTTLLHVLSPLALSSPPLCHMAISLPRACASMHSPLPRPCPSPHSQLPRARPSTHSHVPIAFSSNRTLLPATSGSNRPPLPSARASNRSLHSPNIASITPLPPKTVSITPLPTALASICPPLLLGLGLDLLPALFPPLNFSPRPLLREFKWSKPNHCHAPLRRRPAFL